MKILLIPVFAASLMGHSPAQAHDVAPPAKLLCNTSEAAYGEDNVAAITRAFDQHATKVFGKNWVMTKAAVRQKAKADQKTMSSIAKIAGCAAIMDMDSSCALFFSPEYSMTLGVFTDMPRTVPLRRQFDAALNALPDGAQKKAALSCMKLVAKK